MPVRGRCACGAIRYELAAKPLIVHACHCHDCQRLTGSAFVINLWIEEEKLLISGAEPKLFRLKGGSGHHHDVYFCGECGTYLWSNYHGAPGNTRFVRAGTLDKPETVKPDVHIFTRSKLPWIELPADTPAFKKFYKIDEIWSAKSKARLRINRAKK